MKAITFDKRLSMALLATLVLLVSGTASAAVEIEALDPPDPRAFEPVHVVFSVSGCRSPRLYPELVGNVFRVSYDEVFDADFCGVTNRYMRTLASLPPGDYRVEVGRVPATGQAWQAQDSLEFKVEARSFPPPAGLVIGEQFDLVDVTGLWTVVSAPGGTVLHLYNHNSHGPLDTVTAMFQTFEESDDPTWYVFHGVRAAGERVFVGEFSRPSLIDEPGAVLPVLRLVRAGTAELDLESPSKGALEIVSDASGATSRYSLERYRHR